MRHAKNPLQLPRCPGGLFLLVRSRTRTLFGIIEYLADRNDIRLRTIDPVLMKKTPGVCRLSDYSGFIVSLDGGARFIEELSCSDKPAVLVNIDNSKLMSRRNVSCAWLDNMALGKAGARHLMEIRDIASYGFVPGAHVFRATRHDHNFMAKETH